MAQRGIKIDLVLDDDDEDEYGYKDNRRFGLEKSSGGSVKKPKLTAGDNPYRIPEMPENDDRELPDYDDYYALRRTAKKKPDDGSSKKENDNTVPENNAPDKAEPSVNADKRVMETPKGDVTMKLNVPKAVLEIMAILKDHYYTSYLVGECVYLMYIGERVMDFDIVCNAEPDRIAAIFERTFKVRTDQIDRGELIIINGGMGISVSPFRSRIDGSGRPIYCRTIDEDMCRRTFTSETVAYNPDSGIYDPYGGLACITPEKTVLKAIDEEKYEEMELAQASQKRRKREAPQKVVIPSFAENPESILIAMQKFSRGEAEISPYTLKNMNDNAELLDRIMPEEIARYFRRILLGRRAGDAMMLFREVMLKIFPVLRDQIDFDQKSEYQEYTLYEHTARAVGYAVPDYQVRLALLLHAVGKPDCAADRGDYMTFYGHAERGVMLAGDALQEYGADPRTAQKVLFMIMHHDDRITPDNFMEFSERFGAEDTRLLLLMQSANIRAKCRDELNERVSSVLRQLADKVSALEAPARAQTKRTATIEGLRSITDMMGRK